MQTACLGFSKLARAGYDGRGVQVIKDEAALAEAFDAPGLLGGLRRL
jgi:phosphoribosylaminoimidazole carboxylase (NCAIR synthetase)